MLKNIEALLDDKLADMEKTAGEGTLSYVGISEVQGVAVSAALIFFDGGLGRAICQVTHCSDEFEDEVTILINRINSLAPYRATLEEGVFTLAADFMIPDAPDADRILAILWTLLGAIDKYHIDELRSILGELPNQVG